ncbi:MAG: hypothetical protein DI536_13480 [Archangium gephyra]|uniref:Uncharacterized protein n=1 Tax=Archangium gephyra TaxID=48 RepID=A0A2W5VRV2_9BACT|nr:MAG: hypothetical protein DI536_13480 [Archangium gephyra]
MSPRSHSRAFVTALLLLVQGLSLLHLAVETHTLGQDGAIHDIPSLLADAHDSTDPHLCAPEADAHVAPLSTGCAVIASWRAAVEAPTPVSVELAVTAPPRSTPLPVMHVAQQDVLSRAPKLSPPAV